MILLRPMRENEYPAFLAYFIPDYAQEIASNYLLSPLEAAAKAKQEISEDLYAGVNTSGHILLCLMEHLDNVERHVGYLWYKPDVLQRTVFIYDFYIFSVYQGQGLAKKVLRVLEQNLREKGFEQIRLRVAANNTRAQRLYETTGFGITGVNMSKNIKEQE